MDAFFSFLKVVAIGVFALIALVLVLLAMPQTRFKTTLTELLAWRGLALWERPAWSSVPWT